MTRTRLGLPAVSLVLAVGMCLLAPGVTKAEALSGCPTADSPNHTIWDTDCATAIEAERDPARKAELHFRRAYVLNERQEYLQALDDLNAACTLVPHHASYLHERAFTLNSLARYTEALADLNELAGLDPRAAEVYQERALARARLGDWQGALDDRDKEVKLQPESMSALVARAKARLWLGQFDQARQDLAVAAALKGPSSKEDADFLEHVTGLIDAWTYHSPGPDPASLCNRARSNDEYSQRSLVGDCTMAFLGAKTPVARADTLTQRAIAWVVARQSQVDATEDYQAAVALDPGDPDRHTNLGFAYVQERHSWAALQEFDRSISIRRTYPALAGRAAARYNLGEKDAAFADARASFDQEPNGLALWVLGDLAKDKQQDDLAKSFWMGAYRLGSRDDRLIERLNSVGVTDPAAEASSESPR